MEEISETILHFGMLASTKKMCMNMTTPDAFNKALLATKSFQLDGDHLLFLNSEGETLVVFSK